MKENCDSVGTYACEVGPLNSWPSYRYTVIFARYQGKWIFAKHRDRDTWETVGGHIEPGETPLDCAKRELWEETGAVRFMILPVFDYWARDEVSAARGMTFFAEVEEMGELPTEFEMKQIGLFDSLPDNLTYPFISPVLYSHLVKEFCVGFGSCGEPGK